jgi:hypothetical protein
LTNGSGQVLLPVREKLKRKRVDLQQAEIMTKRSCLFIFFQVKKYAFNGLKVIKNGDLIEGL